MLECLALNRSQGDVFCVIVIVERNWNDNKKTIEHSRKPRTIDK